MTKTFKDVKGIEEACWVGYKKVGMKKKGDRMVPNCVKEEVVDSLLGADYIYENVADMYKGQFSKAQLAKMKQTWATKKASDLTPSVKNFVKGLDQFSQMDIKNANIKYISALIEEVEKGEVELVHKFQNVVEENQMRASIRKSEDLKEFSTDQIERLAKAYSVMKDRTISVANAQKLGKMMDGVPDSSLNAIRKKKIPFLSGLALSRMIQKKIPVTESVYLDEARWHIEGQLSYRGIGSYDAFEMVIDAPTESAAEDKAMKELDKARSQRKIGPGGGGSVEDADIESIERTSARLQAPTQTHLAHTQIEGKPISETHTTQTAKANAHQRSAGGEKSPISHMVNKSIKEITANDGKTFAQMRAEMDEACWDSHKQVGTKMKGGKQVPNCVPKNESKDSEQTYPSKDAKIKGENPADKGKKEQESGVDTRDPKKKTMSGEIATSPEMNPKVDYKY